MHLNMISHIYSKMVDDLSKHIFSNRLLYSITNDGKYMESIMSKMPEGRAILDACNSHRDQKIFIFGCGALGKMLPICFPSIPWFGYVDNNASEIGVVNNLNVFPFEDFLRFYSDSYIVISTHRFQTEIISQLFSSGFTSDNILPTGEYTSGLCDKQYFDLPSLPRVPDEFFVDAGVFDGMSTQNFIKWAGNNYSHAYLFEPDPGLFENINKNLKGHNYTLINKALWNTTGQLSFDCADFGQSSIKFNSAERERESVCVCECDTLDNIIHNEYVTFIKMDIEGAEIPALQGAVNTIKRCHPKLAIAIYHKPDDIINIPRFITTIDDDYNFYIRHYGIAVWETVLYAI